jgi:hypothetical protein
MNDNDLLSQHAWRPDPPPEPVADLNAPIDTMQADCLTLRGLIRGWIADAKTEAARWEPRPYPEVVDV